MRRLAKHFVKMNPEESMYLEGDYPTFREEMLGAIGKEYRQPLVAKI